MAQNNDLINREKAIKDLRAIKDMLVAAGDPFLASVMNRAIGCIENQPAVDATRTDVETAYPELRTVITQLIAEYEKAKMARHIYNPTGYALYQVWKKYE